VLFKRLIDLLRYFDPEFKLEQFGQLLEIWNILKLLMGVVTEHFAPTVDQHRSPRSGAIVNVIHLTTPLLDVYFSIFGHQVVHEGKEEKSQSLKFSMAESKDKWSETSF